MRNHLKKVAPSFLLCLGFLGLGEKAGAIDIHGFGTAGYIQSDSNLYLGDYLTEESKPSLTVLSRFGINFHQKIDSSWSASAQLLANAQDKNFDELLEWGFLSYSPSPQFSIRAGRLIVPAWLNSEAINIGFNYPWTFLPVEVYSLNPVHSLNGISLIAQLPIGSGYIEAHLYAGDGEVTVPGLIQGKATSSVGKAHNGVGAELSYNWKDIGLIRASYFQGVGTVSTNSPFTIPAGTLGPSQPVDLNLTTTTTLDLGLTRFISGGIKIDTHGVLIESEFVRRLFDGAAYNQASGFYACVGYHLGRFMPLYTWSWQGALSGTAYYHPNFPNTLTLLTDEHSSTFGLNYSLTDFVLLKGSVTVTQKNYADPTQNISPTVYAVTANFVF